MQNAVTEVLPSYIVAWMFAPILHSLNLILGGRLCAEFGPLLTGIAVQCEGFPLKF